METRMNNNEGCSATAADESGGIPIPSAEEQDTLLDVWTEALAQVLADRNRESEQTLHSIRAEARAAIAELRSTIADMRSQLWDAIERRVSEKMAQIRQPADGAPGPQGEPGPAGRLLSVTPYVADKVHYAGDVVAFEGGTYQARCDTAKPPGGDDWTCLAAAGKHGSDGRSFRIRGTYNEQAEYQALDVVALNGSSFVAKTDSPGLCPGDGWQLIASAGRPGKPGPRGERGERGARGERGEAPAILGWRIDRTTFSAMPIMSDGSEAAPLELRGLFEQFQIETG
jgi:hypothetical protein